MESKKRNRYNCMVSRYQPSELASESGLCIRFLSRRRSSKNCGATGIAAPSRTSGSAPPPSSRSRPGRRPPPWPAAGSCGPAAPRRSTSGCSASPPTGWPASSRSDRDAGASPLFPPVAPAATPPATPPGALSPAVEAAAAQAIKKEAARGSDGRRVLLYQDELTYYRQPSLARAYEARGRRQPLAVRSHAANTATRAAATLDPFTGRVVPWQGTRFDIPQVVGFYRQVRAAYPEAEQIDIVQDNWPVHFHPDVLVALEPQIQPWPLYRPRHWAEAPSPEAVRRWGGLNLPIQLIPLPTYASWTNPIEKLWRKGKQEVLHLHRWAGQLPVLREEFLRFLAQYALGS